MNTEAWPLVSVVILNHNGAAIMDLLRRSAQAVLAQDYPRIELILADDSSTDGSDRQLEALCRELGATFASTRGNPRHGVSAGRNAALRLAHGEYVAFLDNDAIPQPGWLAALARRMASEPTIGACASRVMFADKPDIINSMGSVLNELFHGNGVCIHEMFEFASWPPELMYATGNGMMLRMEAVRQVGAFDEGYRYYGADDADYGLRLRRAGWRIVPAADAVVLHLHSFSKQEKGMPFWDSRNRVRMALKHQSWRELPRFILRDVPYYLRPHLFKDYVRYWWSTLSDVQGMRWLLAYRWEHRGEPAYAAMFREYFQQPRRLLVVPDNRAFGREPKPLAELRIGEGDEAYLYHGWYWPERWGQTPMRWAMRVASLVARLPQGARELTWHLFPRQDAERTRLKLLVRRLTEGASEELLADLIDLPGPPGAAPLEVTIPCALPQGDYRLILVAEDALIEPGFFPRQIGFGLAGLKVHAAGGGR